MNAPALVKMEDIVKIFPPSNLAINQVSLEIEKGKIHSIIGENGAGKSTLMKILYGLEKPNSGSILLNGKNIHFNSPKEAVDSGIGMVHQEFMLIPSYSVVANVILGYEDTANKLGFVDMQKATEKLLDISKRMGFSISPNSKIEDLSVAVQQKVEILKQLYRKAEILILDEPTAVLAPQEVDEFFKIVKNLKNEGKTIIFISHKLDEILTISDTVTVMRQGRLIWTKENKGLTKQSLAEAMVGRSIVFRTHKENIKPGKPVLTVKNLTLTSKQHSEIKLLNDVSLNVHAKEIVGIAGVEGNGQYELVQTILGLMKPDSGEIKISNELINNDTIRERRKQIAYIPQDRKLWGSCQEETLVNNSYMTHHYLNESINNAGPFLNQRKINEFTDMIIEHFNVICPDRKVTISSLSGGNQQKIIVGREFELNNQLLVLDQPVRGLDVGSIEYIQKRIIDQRDKGAAILLVSADLEELFNISDRIVVMHKGRIVADKRPEDTDRIEIGEFMLGSKGDEN